MNYRRLSVRGKEVLQIANEVHKKDHCEMYDKLQLPKAQQRHIFILQRAIELNDTDLDFDGVHRGMMRSKNPRQYAEDDAAWGWGPPQFDALEEALNHFAVPVETPLSASDAIRLVNDDWGFIALTMVRNPLRSFEEVATEDAISNTNCEWSDVASGPKIPLGSNWAEVIRKYEEDKAREIRLDYLERVS